MAIDSSPEIQHQRVKVLQVLQCYSQMLDKLRASDLLSNWSMGSLYLYYTNFVLHYFQWKYLKCHWFVFRKDFRLLIRCILVQTTRPCNFRIHRVRALLLTRWNQIFYKDQRSIELPHSLQVDHPNYIIPYQVQLWCKYSNLLEHFWLSLDLVRKDLTTIKTM